MARIHHLQVASTLTAVVNEIEEAGGKAPPDLLGRHVGAGKPV
jgi:hypothetical protein